MSTDRSKLDPSPDVSDAGPATDTESTSDTEPATDTESTSDTGPGTDRPKAAPTGADSDGAAGAEPADGKATDQGKAVDQGKPASDRDADREDPDGTAEPADPFSAFGPAPEVVPTRVGLVLRRVGRGLIHEWTLAGLAAVALAVLMTWPALRYPLHTIPQDIWDPTLQAWQMAWSGHILLTDPARLWQANAFYPESWSFAFSDTLLGYAPAGMIGEGPAAAVLRYNIMFVLAHALAAFGAYVLARQLGAARIGAAVAGASFAYAPWLLAQAGHLHVLSNGGIPLALAMLARGHGWSLRHGYRPELRRPGWALSGWLVAAWQLSLGFGIGLVFAYVLALITIVAVAAWFIRLIVRRERLPFGVRLLQADVWGALLFATTGALLALPYFNVAEQHPEARRTAEQLNIYSPPVSGFFTAPAESRIWGQLHEAARATLPWHPETTLLPGFVLYGLAFAGLIFSIWTVRQRLLLSAAVLATAVLAMGTRFFGGTFTYLPLFNTLPGWDGLRTPGRMMIWVTLLLGLLAAGAVTAFTDRAQEISAQVRVPPRPGPFVRLVTLLPLILVLAEGLNATPHPIVPTQPVAMRSAEPPLLVLPSSQEYDENVMLWSTDGFPDIVNGGSGFTPRSLAEVRERTVNFPDPESISYLRQMGVRTVVLLRDRAAGTPWQNAIDLPVDTLGIQREEFDGAVLYRL